MVIPQNILVQKEILMDIHINGHFIFDHLLMKICQIILVEYNFVYMKHIQIIFEVNMKERKQKNHIVFFSLLIVVNQEPFEIEESGWGEFETQITIFFVDPNEKPVF